MASTTISFGSNSSNSNTVPVTTTAGNSSKNTETWKKVAIGGISAIAFGGAAYAATSMLNGEKAEDLVENNTDPENGQETTEPTETPEVVHAPYNPSLQMATSVNDDMTFAQAFAAARAEVHAGGVFQWHGQVYGTYYGNEWDALSPEDQSAFTASTSKVASEHTTVTPQKDDHIAQTEPIDVTPEDPEPNPHADDDTAEVVIERIEYDPENEASMAYVTVNGNEVILADIDNDGVFDVLYADDNHDGMVDESEVYHITDENITVEGLGGYTEPTLDGYIDEDFLANNDTDIDSIEF